MFRQLFEEELFMYQYVTEPTRLCSILDLVFSDNRELVSDVTIGEGLGKSDHSIVNFNISCNVRLKDNILLVPNFNQADFDKMRSELAQIDWSSEFARLDTCESWNYFKTILKAVQSRHIPLKYKRNRKNDRPPWLTPEVRNAIKTKRAAFKTMKRSPIDSNKRSYQKSRDEVKRRVRAAKRAKEIVLARNCTADSKGFFSFYKMNNVSKSIGPLKANNMLVSKDNEMVELLSNQFSSVFTIEDQSGIALLHPPTVTEETLGELGNVSSDLVRAYLKKLKPNKAEGPDNIYARVLKECEREISVPLAIIFSRSLKETKIPLDWKSANVVHIFKKVIKVRLKIIDLSVLLL